MLLTMSGTLLSSLHLTPFHPHPSSPSLPLSHCFTLLPLFHTHLRHPFTISSAYHEGYIGIHMRIVGDWTGQVYKLLNPTGKLGLIQSHMVTAPNGKPIFLIDGPFGAASDLVHHVSHQCYFNPN